MMRILATIAAIAVAGGLVLEAVYLAGTALSFMLQHLQFTRFFAFAAPFVAAISISVAITVSRQRRDID